jgi:hypothetical protein
VQGRRGQRDSSHHAGCRTVLLLGGPGYSTVHKKIKLTPPRERPTSYSIWAVMQPGLAAAQGAARAAASRPQLAAAVGDDVRHATGGPQAAAPSCPPVASPPAHSGPPRRRRGARGGAATQRASRRAAYILRRCHDG